MGNHGGARRKNATTNRLERYQLTERRALSLQLSEIRCRAICQTGKQMVKKGI